MKEERSWKFKETLIKRTEILVSTSNRMDFGNNGTLSMLMNGRENLEKENSTKTSVLLLREISILFPNYHPTDISI
jgi:hypothetical protein